MTQIYYKDSACFWAEAAACLDKYLQWLCSAIDSYFQAFDSTLVELRRKNDALATKDNEIAQLKKAIRVLKAALEKVADSERNLRPGA